MSLKQTVRWIIVIAIISFSIIVADAGRFSPGSVSSTGNVSYPINVSNSSLISGSLPVENGGTGATTAAGAKDNLGAGFQPQDFTINVSGGNTYNSMYGRNNTVLATGTVLGHVINSTIIASGVGSKIVFTSGSFCFAANQSHAEVNKSNITISGQGESTVIRLCDPTRNTAFFIIERASNVTIRNMKLISAGSDQYNGEASGAQVRNQPQSPIYLRESSDNIIEDLTIYDSPHYSIADFNGTNNTIRRVKGYNSYYSDIILGDTQDNKIEDSVSVGSRLGHGIYLEWAYRTRFSRNALINNALDGARINNSYDSVASDNYISGNRYGISNDNSSNTTLRDNDIAGASDAGIILGFMATPKTKNSTLIGNKIRSQGRTLVGVKFTAYADYNAMFGNDLYQSGIQHDILDQGIGNSPGMYVDNGGKTVTNLQCFAINRTCTNNTGIPFLLHGDDVTGSYIWFTTPSTGMAGTDGGLFGSDGTTTYIINRENGDVRFYTNNVQRAQVTNNGFAIETLNTGAAAVLCGEANGTISKRSPCTT